MKKIPKILTKLLPNEMEKNNVYMAFPIRIGEKSAIFLGGAGIGHSIFRQCSPSHVSLICVVDRKIVFKKIISFF